MQMIALWFTDFACEGAAIDFLEVFEEVLPPLPPDFPLPLPLPRPAMFAVPEEEE